MFQNVTLLTKQTHKLQNTKLKSTQKLKNDAAVVAAKAALEAYGSGHLYDTYVAKVEAARAEARNVVRNKYVARLQDAYRDTAVAEGKYWNDPTGVQDKQNT